MSEEVENMDYELEGDDEITFDDAPPQVKPSLSPAPKPKAVKVAAPKPKKARKPKVATKPATAKVTKKHRVETIDNNKLAGYLDNLTNNEGYELISVSGSSSIMGAFTVVSVKNS